MVISKRIDPPGYTEVTTAEPFQMQDLLDQAQGDTHLYGATEVFERPLLLDFRAVDLLKFSAQDFRRLINRRVEIGGTAQDVPCAFVAGSDAGFGMLRMYGAYAEVGGLRGNDSILMTTDYIAARQWIEQQAMAFHQARRAD